MTESRESFETAYESEPDIARHANRIDRRVARARNDLLDVMGGVNIENLTRAGQQTVFRQVNGILTELDGDLETEVTAGIDDVYEQGRARTLVALGLFGSIGAARRYLRSKEATASRAHRSFRMADIETTMDDLLTMTQNTRRRVKSEVRRVAAETFRTDESVRSQRRQMSRQLKDASIFAIRDRAGRRWKIDHYANVVVTTKLTEAHRNATEQEAREQGAGYVMISTHANPCQKCVSWEGRLLRIDDSVDGSEPTLADAIAAGLFHPACKHNETPVRNPEILPDWVRK